LKGIRLIFAVITIVAAGLAARVSSEVSGSARSVAGKIDINSASSRELEMLPGVGAELAERIIRDRPYRKLDELIARKVLGRKQFARIKDRIRIMSTPPATGAQ
jgi:DNA uptake protein ComE-like DNA-binding protein